MKRIARGAILLAALLFSQFLPELVDPGAIDSAVVRTFGAAVIHAQSRSAPAPDERPLVTVFNAEFLRDLPTADNLFGVIDALQPSIISDRFSAGGLETGQPARLGGFLSSFRQTIFRIDGVSITDPTGNGAPVLVPELMLWDRIRVGTGLFRPDTNSTGLAIDLVPASPTDEWTRNVEASSSHAGLAGHARATGAPAIARLAASDRAAVVAGGPLRDARFKTLVAASWTRSSQFSRDEPFPADSSVGSVFSHAVFTRSLADSIRLVGWLQQRSTPLQERFILAQPEATNTDTGGHVQAVWQHGEGSSRPWRAFASYSGRRHTPDYDPVASGIAERLVDGPVTEFAWLAKQSVQTWSLGAHVEPLGTVFGHAHRLEAGVDATSGRARSSSFFSGTIGELVHGSPGRVWSFKTAETASLRHGLTIGGYVGDRVRLTPELNLEAGLRLESATGRADGAANGIGWWSMLPRVFARWTVSDGLAAFGGYARSGYRLALDDLAVGDPGAPTADVFRWNALAGSTLPLSARGSLVSRVGPGTGGMVDFAAIDRDLQRPTSDEIVLGLEGMPRENVLVRLTGVARKERNLLGVVNVGVSESSAYTSFTVSDPGGNVLSPEDDQILTVYNRVPSSFGRDQYLLTNPEQTNPSFKGLEISLQIKIGMLSVSGGGTAGLAEGAAANRGFGPAENDQAVLGELFSNPNARTLARGRLFTDRAFTGKLVAIYRFPADIGLGLVARYQDGRPFARVLVFPGLNQGAEAVRAFSNGVSRFMFVGTLDARLRKGFVVAGRRVETFLDVFNLPGRANSVEEDVAAPPDVRNATAVQPPRAIHLGVRVAF